MADFTLAIQEIEIIPDYNVAVTTYENKAEQRRLISSNELIGWKITSPPTSKTDALAYRTFFQGKYGALTSFTFDCPLDDTEYTVRYDPGSFRISHNATKDVWQCEFNFVRLP